MSIEIIRRLYMKYFLLFHSERTFNFLYFVQQFFASFNFALRSIRNAGGSGNYFKRYWVSG